MHRPAEQLTAMGVFVAGFLMVLLSNTSTVPVLESIQRPLRISQSWLLYGGAPNRRFSNEIWVDGTLRYRSGDPEHTWLRSELRYRRIRPVFGVGCRGDSKNSDVLLRWLAKRARADFQDVQRVEIRCFVGPFPGLEQEETKRMVISAPDWEPVL